MSVKSSVLVISKLKYSYECNCIQEAQCEGLDEEDIFDKIPGD